MKKKILLVLSLIVSFFLPAIVFLITLKQHDILPFGSHTLLFTDSQGQYISFLSYFRTIFSSTNNLVYTFSKPLGGEMIYMFCYYLVSPFNIIYLFFNRATLPLAVSIVTTLKVGSFGLTMYIFMNYIHKEKYLSNLIFALSYALCSYVIVYNFNYLFLDGAILLPLVALGLERIFENKKNTFYALALGITIIINFYIGFMVCLFAVMFFFYKLYSVKYDKEKTKDLYKSFIYGSLIAGALSSISWLLAIINMSGTKTSPFFNNFSDFKLLWEIPDFLSNFFGGSYSGMADIMQGPPLVFIGCTSLALFIMYFFNRKITIREKIASGTITIAFVIIMAISVLNDLFHGGAAPTWFPFRFAFLFDFLLIYLASKEFNNLDGLKYQDLIFPIAIDIILFAIFKAYDLKTNILTDFAILVANLVLIYLVKIIKIKWLKYIFIVVIVSNNIYNLADSAKSNFDINLQEAENGSSNYVLYETYQNEINEIGKVVDFVKKYDVSNTFYRMEKTFYSQATFNFANNDSFMFDYAGVSHYSSCDNLETRNYIGNHLGFHSNSFWNSYGLGSTLTANALMGIKYIIDRDFMRNSVLITDRHFGARDYLNQIQTFDSYQGDKIHVMENPYALSLAYLANYRSATTGRVGEWIYKTDENGNVLYDENNNPLYDYETDEDGNEKLDENGQKIRKVKWYNIFEYQNFMLKDLTGQDFGDVFLPLDYTTTYGNLTVLDNTHFALTNNANPGFLYYNVNLSNSYNDNKHYPSYYYITPSFSQYMNFYDYDSYYGNLYYFNMYNYGINPLISNKQNKSYTLRLNENLIWNNTEIKSFFYYENIDILHQYIDVLKSNEITLEKVSSSYFKGTGTYNSIKTMLATSIPYDKRWKVYINGHNVKTRIHQDIFLASDLINLNLQDGELFNITIKYEAIENIICIFIVLIGLGCLIVFNYDFINKIKNKVFKNKSTDNKDLENKVPTSNI